VFRNFVLARAGEITPRGHVPRFHNGENLGTAYLSILATLSPETSRAQRAELTLSLNPVCPRGNHRLALTRYCQYFIAIKGVVGEIYCAIL